MRRVDLASLDFSSIVKKGDMVIWGQACGEPLSLTRALMAQRHAIGGFRVFMGSCFSDSIKPEQGDVVQFYGIGGVGANRPLIKAGVFEVMPIHLSSVDSQLDSGILPCDVALIQVSPRRPDGKYGMGLITDYIRTAVRKARVVVAEVNSMVPQTTCEEPLDELEIDFFVEVAEPPVEIGSGSYGELENRIAAAAAAYIPERATMQMGNGAIPEAIMALLRERRGLGVHSGMIGDSVADLMAAGVVTNEHKEIDRGISITGCLMGTRKLFAFADNNKALMMCSVWHTHSQATLSKLARFISINSALEVDLTGQVNAEAAGRDYIGAVGGQVDFVRAAATSAGGCSMIALPSLGRGNKSKIVAQLNGPVTTGRSDVGVIVTEHGAADLRGKSLQQRIKAMIAIADPSQREGLERAVREAP